MTFTLETRAREIPSGLQEKCRELGIGCDVLPKVTMDGVTVSSTYIRQLLVQGKMQEAMRFLGHPHCLSGEVVHAGSWGAPLVFLRQIC